MNRQKMKSIKKMLSSVAVAAGLLHMTLFPCPSTFASSAAIKQNRDKQMKQSTSHIKHKTNNIKKRKHKVYIPTEKITADQAVAFPADI